MKNNHKKNRTNSNHKQQKIGSKKITSEKAASPKANKPRFGIVYSVIKAKNVSNNREYNVLFALCDGHKQPWNQHNYGKQILSEDFIKMLNEVYEKIGEA